MGGRREPGHLRHVGVVALVVALLVVGVSACSGPDGADGATGPTTARPSGSTTATTTTAPVPPSPPSSVPAVGGAASQPVQPTSGPGGSALPHGNWRESSGGEGASAWYVFEPTDPRPAEAPVSIVLHGYDEYEGHASMDELIRHTVRTGSIVIYPRWQTNVAEPCAGPVDIEPCLRAAADGVHGALAFLRAGPTRVQPDVDRTSWFGFSFGGIITLDLANRYDDFDLPEPRAIFLDDPHDGGLTGNDEPAVDDDLAGIPSEVLVVCHSGAQGVISEPGLAGGSCNAVWPKLSALPADHKALVMTRPDDHGRPALSSQHGVCSAPEGRADAYDWGFCWKAWDALRSAALDGGDPSPSLGHTPEQRSNGIWSDGTPVVPLVVQAEAPLVP